MKRRGGGTAFAYLAAAIFTLGLSIGLYIGEKRAPPPLTSAQISWQIEGRLEHISELEDELRQLYDEYYDALARQREALAVEAAGAGKG